MTRIQGDRISLVLQAPLKPGDGVVFDSGHPAAKEEGGRVYCVESRGRETVLTFGRDALNSRRLHLGDRLWKTSDPELDRHLQGDTLLPLSELNRIRRDLVAQLDTQRAQPQPWQLHPTASLQQLLPTSALSTNTPATPELIALVRHLEQLEGAIAAGVSTLYCEFEDPRKYKQAVERTSRKEGRKDEGGRMKDERKAEG